MPHTSPCFLHVPHKDWSSDVERENYDAIEQWNSRWHLDNPPSPVGRRYELHIPNKEWDPDLRERDNYAAIERWVDVICLISNGDAGRGPRQRWDLFIPYKDWSDNQLELENYLAIERWAYYFIRNCLHGGGG